MGYFFTEKDIINTISIWPDVKTIIEEAIEDLNFEVELSINGCEYEIDNIAFYSNFITQAYPVLHIMTVEFEMLIEQAESNKEENMIPDNVLRRAKIVNDDAYEVSKQFHYAAVRYKDFLLLICIITWEKVICNIIIFTGISALIVA